jgi:PAS domain S-box-containing protein
MNDTQSTFSILIVDDNPHNLNLLSRILSEEGYKVRPAPSGKMALRSIDSTLPDLILLDIMMPEMDGYQVCQLLKNSERTKNIPVVFISSLNEVFDKVKAFSLGGVDYISKPFEPQEVLARVENQIRITKLNKQILQKNAQLSQEIEERKRVEETLRQQQEILQKVFDHIPVMVAVYDEKDQVQLVNQELEHVLGWKSEEMKSIDSLAECFPDPEYRALALEHILGGTGKWQDFTVKIRDGSYLDTSWANTRLTNGKVICFGQDITERKRAENASILEERNRIAREIHDTLAQAFTGITVHLAAASRVISQDILAAAAHITQARDLSRMGLAEARRSVEALRSQLLTNSDLYSALSSIVAQMSSVPNTQIDCYMIGTARCLPSKVENHLLRIGQEALTNAIKHAKASVIQVELRYEPTQCVLRVTDNGKGFAIDSVSLSGSFGILGIRERCASIGAKLVIDSQAGQGTEVIVSFT